MQTTGSSESSCENSLGGTWVHTYYSAPGKNGADLGSIYYPEAENFSPPQPYPSWIFNTDTYQWDPPVSQPDDGQMYTWVKETTSWVVVPPLQ